MNHFYLNGEVTVQPEDIEPHPIEHLLRYGSDDPSVQTFIDVYLRPLQRHIRGGTIEITKPGFRLDHLWFYLLGVKPPDDKPVVPDPTPQLNYLLYEVMKSGYDTLPISIAITYGFANCGRGFFSAFRYLIGKKALLAGEVRFPPYLVVERANGERRWTRAPENGREQLYHFLYFFRETMSYLANNPIGKKSTLSATDVAHMLTQLPRRAAFVRSGEDVGVIYTDDTPPPVDSATFHERLRLIRDQTRQKYCRPVNEPEDTTLDELDDTMLRPAIRIEKPQVSRWEEVE